MNNLGKCEKCSIKKECTNLCRDRARELNMVILTKRVPKSKHHYILKSFHVK